MKLIKSAMAGTLESSDVRIMLCPREGSGIEIELDSVVKAQFGLAIEGIVRQTLAEFDIEDAYVQLQDKGALDCVIKARIQCAICRACEMPYDWTKEDLQNEQQ